MSAPIVDQSPSWELQKAVVGRMKADSALLTLLGGDRVYDFVPEKVDFPYVTYGETDDVPWDTSTEYGEEMLPQINVWSEGEGRKECELILRRIRVLLQDQEIGLTLTGHHLVSLRFVLKAVVQEPDGQRYHGVMRFRAITEEI